VYAVAPPGAYAYWVRQATQRLRDSFFGSWQGHDGDGTPNPLKDTYDKTFWQRVDQSVPPFEIYLQLIAGKQPADAVDAIFDGLSDWKIDCDHTVQISNLYALRRVLGAAAFNLRAGPQMQLRARSSSGLTTVSHFGRDNPTDQWGQVVGFDLTKVSAQDVQHPSTQVGSPFTFAPGPRLTDTTEQLVARATAGSRVRFTNLKASLADEFRHENCVKLANDLYAAGGLDDPVTGNEFSRDRVEVELALFTNAAPTRAYIQANILIDEIETFAQN
jgi:hypothetical protein